MFSVSFFLEESTLKRIELLLMIVALASISLTSILVRESMALSGEDSGLNSTSYSWAMFGHDQGHTGFSPSTAPDTNNTLWTYPFVDEHGNNRVVAVSPAVANGKVFLATAGTIEYDPEPLGDKFYALNATTGDLIWTYPIGSRVHSSPTVVDGMLFVGSDDWKIYALNETTGTLIWSYSTGSRVVSSPVVSDGIVYVGSLDGNLYALNETTGALLWKYPTEGGIYSSPAVDDEKVFFGVEAATIGYSGWDGKVYALNKYSGEHIWNYTYIGTNYTTGGLVYASPTVSYGKVFISSERNQPYNYVTYLALNESTGTLIWKRGFKSSYSVASRNTPVAYDKIFVGLGDGNVYALDENTGRLVWKSELGSGASPSSVADGKVFAYSSVGNLFALNVSTGEVVWSSRSIGGFRTAVANGKIFVVGVHPSLRTELICFGPPPSLTINPTFNDNDGSPLDPPPSSWSILFPNGTTKTIYSSSVTFPEIQTGNHTIVSIVWQGTEVVPEAPPTIRVFSDTLWSPTINCRIPTTIDLSLSTSTSYIGFRVSINGRLYNYKNVSLSEIEVLLQYSVSGGQSWDVITTTTTSTDGSFSATWIPSATGNYLVKASWSGYDIYPGTNTLIELAVIPFQEQHVFSVVSNSTVSSLVFNSTSGELVFTVSGSPGTRGYVDATIAKTLVAKIDNIKVYIDGQQTSYVVTSQDDSWLIHFTYHHSTRTVTISLGPIPFIPPQLITPQTLVIITLCLAIATAAIIRKIRKGTPPTILNGAFRKFWKIRVLLFLYFAIWLVA